MKLIQILSIIVSGLMVNSCTITKEVWDFEAYTINKGLHEKILRGHVKSGGNPLIGVGLIQKGTANDTLTDINGNFKLVLDSKGDFDLIINPCCTCYYPTEIKIEQNVFELLIDCNCKKSRVIVTKRYMQEGIVKEKVKKKKIR